MSEYAHRLYLRALRLAKAKHRRPEVWGLLERAHRLGDADATYAMATWYLFGRHGKKDVKEAANLLRQAAEGGNASAMFDLAVCAEKGAGVKKDVARAAELYVKSGLLGDVEAMECAGRCFWYGIGVTEDRCIATAWLEAAERRRLGETTGRK